MEIVNFDVKEIHRNIVNWIREWFDKNGKDCIAVIGLSGGKDSTVAASLCAEALGSDRVIGVAMPDCGQGTNDADMIANYLGIKYLCVPIGAITNTSNMSAAYTEYMVWSAQAKTNIPPRVRMMILYAISQTCNGRPSCNCNLSEDYVGYATLFGDDAASFAPLKNLTVTEILALGDEMGLPYEWIHKTPDDGLPNSTSDENKFGFTYEVLDRYIRTGVCEDVEIKAKIDTMHKKNKFKTQILNVPSFEIDLPVFEDDKDI